MRALAAWFAGNWIADMAGLMSKRKGTTVEGEVEASPEEQAQYEQFVTNGMNMMYDQQGLPTILQSLSGAGSPVEGLANTLAMMVMRLEDSAADAGQEISGDAMYAGVTEQILPLLVELADAGGVHEYKEEEVDAALFQALDIYRSTRQQAGQLDEEALQGDMAMLMQAEQDGTIGEVLPGIDKFAKAERNRGNNQ